MELKDVRNRIDDIDEKLVGLFEERMQLSKDVAEAKTKEGLNVYNPTREREVLSKVTEGKGDLELYINSLYRTIFELSKTYQRSFIKGESELAVMLRNMRENRLPSLPQSASVVCQGVEGAYSQMASDKLFSRGNLTFVSNFEAVFDAVDKGLCEFGILPIDNSTNGSVKQVYDLMIEKKFYIAASTKLFVRHELLAKKGTDLSNLKAIYSHEQGLQQCSDFLKDLPDTVDIIPCDNTAMAAKFVAESDEKVAAVSSHLCREIYGLENIAGNIQNNENNYTKFIAITKEPTMYEGANHINLLMTLSHTPGALFDIMSKFAALGINLTNLESHPIPGQDFEFMFFFELEASIADDKVIDMLSTLESSCEKIQFLGNYIMLR